MLDFHPETLAEQIGRAAPTQANIPNFNAFESTSELWSDYYSRFQTFVRAHSVPARIQAQVFLTNQVSTTYKLLSNLAAQEEPPVDINALTLQQIVAYMGRQFDPKRFVVRERFRFWSDMSRKPGETVPELAARIRQAAATCGFTNIRNPLDEALRTRFICSVNNEAVLKALFKINDDELTFSRAIEIASETEDAAKVAKETVFGTAPAEVRQIRRKVSRPTKPTQKSLIYLTINVYVTVVVTQPTLHQIVPIKMQYVTTAKLLVI